MYVDIERKIFGLNLTAAVLPKWGTAHGIASATPHELMGSDNITYPAPLLLIMPQMQHVSEDEMHTKPAISAKSAINI